MQAYMEDARKHGIRLHDLINLGVESGEKVCIDLPFKGKNISAPGSPDDISWREQVSVSVGKIEVSMDGNTPLRSEMGSLNPGEEEDNYHESLETDVCKPVGKDVESLPKEDETMEEETRIAQPVFNTDRRISREQEIIKPKKVLATARCKFRGLIFFSITCIALGYLSLELFAFEIYRRYR